MEKNKWWAYVHTNGNLIVKRFLCELDLDDAHESPFILKVFNPVEADTKEEAIKKIMAEARMLHWRKA